MVVFGAVASSDVAEQALRSSLQAFHALLCVCRVLPALLSALFFNMHLQLFGPLFTGYMGMGDKETFQMAMIAHHLPYSMIPITPRTLGTAGGEPCIWGTKCGKRVHLNTMVQVDPAGEIVFLHANMQKWLLAVETAFDEYPRRWQILMPGPDMRMQPWPELSLKLFGCAPANACLLLLRNACTHLTTITAFFHAVVLFLLRSASNCRLQM